MKRGMFTAITRPVPQILILLVLLFAGCEKDEDNPETNTSTVADIDGNVYHTVTIGDQVWMVENLKTTRYRNGDMIPNVSATGDWAALTTGGWCYYDNNNSNQTTYGKLYNWYAVNDSRNLAPVGWHIATDYDYFELASTIDGNALMQDGIESQTAGGKLKKTGYTFWTSPNTGADDTFGFAAMGGGYRSNSGTFLNLTIKAYFWTVTEYSTSEAWYRNLLNDDQTERRLISNKASGFSVRCVRD